MPAMAPGMTVGATSPLQSCVLDYDKPLPLYPHTFSEVTAECTQAP